MALLGVGEKSISTFWTGHVSFRILIWKSGCFTLSFFSSWTAVSPSKTSTFLLACSASFSCAFLHFPSRCAKFVLCLDAKECWSFVFFTNTARAMSMSECSSPFSSQSNSLGITTSCGATDWKKSDHFMPATFWLAGLLTWAQIVAQEELFASASLAFFSRSSFLIVSSSNLRWRLQCDSAADSFRTMASCLIRRCWLTWLMGLLSILRLEVNTFM